MGHGACISGWRYRAWAKITDDVMRDCAGERCSDASLAVRRGEHIAYEILIVTPGVGTGRED
jgi:hypothetical protein